MCMRASACVLIHVGMHDYITGRDTLWHKAVIQLRRPSPLTNFDSSSFAPLTHDKNVGRFLRERVREWKRERERERERERGGRGRG